MVILPFPQSGRNRRCQLFHYFKLPFLSCKQIQRDFRERRTSSRWPRTGTRGYGKYVKLRHTNGYETAYGHMSAFARGIQPGTRVRQGQIIGYVGSTGLSTGPHLHYEILVNNRFVDPLKIKLPRGSVLDGPTLANFEKDRDRYDGMMNRPAPRMAKTGGTTRR